VLACKSDVLVQWIFSNNSVICCENVKTYVQKCAEIYIVPVCFKT
jgi:hypothetical protein